MIPGQNEALKQWKQLCQQIQSMTSVDEKESEATRLKRIARAQRDYEFFVQYYFPHWCLDKITGQSIPCAKFHTKAAEKILNNTTLLAVFEWARGHAKSTHMGVFIPMWLMCQKNPTIHNMVLAGKSEDSAKQLLGDLQAELQYNKRYERDFGKQYNAGQWTDGQFVTLSGCSFTAIGRGQSPRGLRDRQYRPDYILCDDLDDDELSRNPDRVRQATEWTREALMGTFGAEDGRFIMVGNLISKTSILANIKETDGCLVSQVNAIDSKGNPSWPEYWTRERLEEKRKKMGYRSFQKEMMNNPITIGAIFDERWITYGKMLPLRQYKQLVCYTDPSWKASKKNDYKATMLIGKTPSGEFHVLKAFADQTSVTNMILWLYNIREYVDGKVPIHYYMEANMLQELLVQQVNDYGKEHGVVIAVRADKRAKPDKFSRIEALQPLFEQGLVIFNQEEKDSLGMQTLVSQLLALERGSREHDDAPDALEGGIWILDHRWSRSSDSLHKCSRIVSSRHI